MNHFFQPASTPPRSSSLPTGRPRCRRWWISRMQPPSGVHPLWAGPPLYCHRGCKSRQVWRLSMVRQLQPFRPARPRPLSSLLAIPQVSNIIKSLKNCVNDIVISGLLYAQYAAAAASADYANYSGLVSPLLAAEYSTADPSGGLFAR